MNRAITSIFVMFTLLLSMTEVSKVTLMGYTLLTDSEKAAHLCACMNCSHGNDSETEHCSTNMGDSEHAEGEGGDKAMHCSISQPESSMSYCGCNSSPINQVNIFFNTLDKTALLATLAYSVKEIEQTFFREYRAEEPVHINREIFHPPRA